MGKPLTFGEYLIDVVNFLPVMAGRIAGTHRRFEFQMLNILALEPQACETQGLAWKIFER